MFRHLKYLCLSYTYICRHRKLPVCNFYNGIICKCFFYTFTFPHSNYNVTKPKYKMQKYENDILVDY